MTFSWIEVNPALHKVKLDLWKAEIVALGGGGGGAPIGSIMLWSMLNGSVPTGYVECDGTQNAPGPDLRDRFILGRSAGHAVDTTGGLATHTHTDNLTHAGAAVDAHSALSHAGTAVTSHPATATSQANVGATKTGTSASTVTILTHTHNTPILAHTVTQPNDHAALSHTVTQPSAHGSHAATNSEPPYYVMLYIQRMI